MIDLKNDIDVGDRVMINKGIVCGCENSQPEAEGIVFSIKGMHNHENIHEYCVVHAKGSYFTDNKNNELRLIKKAGEKRLKMEILNQQESIEKIKGDAIIILRYECPTCNEEFDISSDDYWDHELEIEKMNAYQMTEAYERHLVENEGFRYIETSQLNSVSCPDCIKHFLTNL